jgi:tRNA nucleotidyltransferase (CCA-adding enzyme)
MPDYMFLLESRLSPEQHAAMVRVQELAQNQGVNVYLTGGAVRDLISGGPIRDLDFTVEGNPSVIVRELAKGGARVVAEAPKLRETELIFHGDVDGSVAEARDEVYALPGTRPEHHWATIMEDLRRRDFSCNAVAISLNPASRGLLLDPTNGLADIERREVRALSIHCFTNQPARLLRILRYAARLDFKMESRTGEWFELAIDRGLDKQISPADVGRELRQLGNEEHPAAVLKAWEAHGLLATIHPHLARKRPDYDGLGRLARVTDQMTSAGLKLRLFAPTTWYLLRKLTSRERALALRKLGFRADEVAAVAKLEAAAKDAQKALKGRQTEAPKDAYRYLEKLPRDVMAFVQSEHSNPRINSKIRNYLHKWRPMRLSLPAAELEALGVARGPQFDQILEQFFDLQLKGKGKTAVDRDKLLRQLAGIKPEPKPKKKPEKKTAAKPAAQGKAAAAKPAPKPAAKPASKPAAKAKPAAAKATAKGKPSKAKAAAKAKASAKKAKPKGRSSGGKKAARAKPARGRKKASARR